MNASLVCKSYLLYTHITSALSLSQEYAVQVPEDESGASDTASAPNLLEVPFSGIEGSLKRLDRVAIIIL
jgi:hypothetical protein